MKKLLLTILLVVFSTGATAEWKFMISDGDAYIYIEPTSKKRRGSMVTIWRLHDFIIPQLFIDNIYYSSSVVKVEYDCEYEIYNLLEHIIYEDKFAKGMVVNRWKPKKVDIAIAPHTIEKMLMESACGKN